MLVLFSSIFVADTKIIFGYNLIAPLLKVVSTTCFLVFLKLKEKTCENRNNIFYFTSKALFILKKIKV